MSDALIVVALATAFSAGMLELRSRPAPAPLFIPWATVGLFLVVALPTVMQFVVPELLPALQRDPAGLERGEVWRLATALVVQDGGAAGAAFNLATLALVGALAERLWRWRATLALFLVGALAGELAGLAWQPVGAGNSVGNFGMAAGVAVACLLGGAPRGARVLSAVALAAMALLALTADHHGVAGLAGAALALALARRAGRTPLLT